MRLATTTGDFGSYCKTYKERIKHLYEAGFRYIDLSLYTVREEDELLVSADWKENAEHLKAYAEGLGMKFVQAHAPGGNPMCKDDKYDVLLKATIRSIEVCGVLGIPNIVVHSGFEQGVRKQEYFEKNKLFFEELFPHMEKWNVNVLCENSTKANMKDSFFPNSGADMKAFVEYVNHPLFHACWDTGHAHIEGPQYDEIMTLGKELYALHISDNRGEKDEHLIPFLGTISMDEVMNALIDSGYQGYFTMEAEGSLRSANCWLGKRYRFKEDDRLASPQLFMQKQMEKLMYEIGVYILKSYNCYEE